MIDVRYATTGDLSFVGQDGYVSTETVQRKIDTREIAVAEIRGEAAGYVRIEYLWSKIPYIALIRVMPTFQRQGIGRTLLAFLEKELYAAGHRVLLSSSQADEPEPQAWHLHMGFRRCGRLEGINDGGVDELFFALPLQPPA